MWNTDELVPCRIGTGAFKSMRSGAEREDFDKVNIDAIKYNIPLNVPS